jgi:glutamate racemase
MLAQGIDTVVLGCTHYPFVIPQIQRIVGTSVRVIDPAPAIARQTGKLLREHPWLSVSDVKAETIYYTTGNSDRLQDAIRHLLQQDAAVHSLSWLDQKELRKSS